MYNIQLYTIIIHKIYTIIIIMYKYKYRLIHRQDAIKSLFILTFIINIRVCDVNIIIGVEFK
jgi:hypothetical protein